MKATGIVRRIDDLGRVVIPREIRRTLRIREGDPLEIFTDKDGCVIFKKYSILGDIEDAAKNACNALLTSGISAAVFDNFGDWATGANSLRTYHEALADNLDERGLWMMSDNIACRPILSDGEIGGYVIYKREKSTSDEVVKTMATMLGYALSR